MPHKLGEAYDNIHWMYSLWALFSCLSGFVNIFTGLLGYYVDWDSWFFRTYLLPAIKNNLIGNK